MSTRPLKPWAQEEANDFERLYGMGNCSCHISPPCSSCTHPGNPSNLAEDDEAWGFDIDYECDAAMSRLRYQIEQAASQHIAEIARGATTPKTPGGHP